MKCESSLFPIAFYINTTDPSLPDPGDLPNICPTTNVQYSDNN